MKDRAALVAALACVSLALVAGGSLAVAAAGADAAAYWLRVVGNPLALAVLAGALMALAHRRAAPTHLPVLLFAVLLAFGVGWLVGPRLRPSIQAAQLAVAAVAWTAVGLWVLKVRARVGPVLSWATAVPLALGVLGYALSFLVQLWPRLLAPGSDVPPHLRQTVLAQRISLWANLSVALQIASAAGLFLLGVWFLRLRRRQSGG